MAIPTLETQLRDCHYQPPVAGHTGKVSRHDPVYSPIPSRGANEREYRLQPSCELIVASLWRDRALCTRGRVTIRLQGKIVHTVPEKPILRYQGNFDYHHYAPRIRWRTTAVSGPSYVSDLDVGLGTIWILESIDQIRTLRPEVSCLGNDGARGSWNTSFKRQWKV